MTAFVPKTRSIDPPLHHDALGEALVITLRRDMGRRLTWNLPTVLLLGLLTAGLVPLVILALRFRTFAIAQKFQLEHVEEWLGQHGRNNDALGTAIANLRGVWPWTVAASLGLTALALGVAVAQIVWISPDGAGLLSLLTVFRPSDWGIGYAATVSAGYLVQIVGIRAFARRVETVAARLDEAMQSEDLKGNPVVPPAILARSIWWIAGCALLAAGIVWGLWMMLAAGAHNRYINQISDAFRRQTADRIATMMEAGLAGGIA